MDSKLPSSSPQDHDKTSKQTLCKLFQGSLPGEICQKTLIFQWFLKIFAISPVSHISCQPPPSAAQDLPQDAPLDPQEDPRKPKTVQDRSKMGQMGQEGSKIGPTRLQDCFPTATFALTFSYFFSVPFPFEMGGAFKGNPGTRPLGSL